MRTNSRLLVIGKVWPEPESSAAGSRMLHLISFFTDIGYEVAFCTAARESEFASNLQSIGVESYAILLNDSSFDELLLRLEPDVVLFDRFMTEEQFGWRVDQQLPETLKILDTEDLHFLREARKKAVFEHKEANQANLYSESTKREIASILRCDLSLMISKAEIEILISVFNISPEIVCYLPLKSKQIKQTEIENTPLFDDRKDFISIGNFLHAPNWDSVLYLKDTIWPKIKEKVPEAFLAIYGAYPSKKVFQLHDEKEGFMVYGRAKKAKEVLENSKVLLAPLRFGAGQKGKLLSAMQAGTPSVTTWIGAEGMIKQDQKWPGFIVSSEEKFIDTAINLYLNQEIWQKTQSRIPMIVNSNFADPNPWMKLEKRMVTLIEDLPEHRNRNFVGELLKHHQHASTKYMGKWIEEKNKRN